MASVGSRKTLEPEILLALPVVLNIESVPPESGTKHPLHYSHNLKYVLQKMQHCSLNITEQKISEAA